MSKIIKESKEFVPENILPEHADEPPVWGNFAKKVEEKKRAPAPPSPAAPPTKLKAGSSPKKRKRLQDESQFNSDFSAPASQQPQAPAQPEPAPETVQQPAIDIEAIAEENYKKGLQAGIERMENDFGSSVKTLLSACEQINTIRDTILKNSIVEMRELVLIIAEKIIRHSVVEQHQTIQRTVEDSIQQAVKSDEFIISVNPNDLDFIKSKSQEFINSISGLENIIVRSDPQIEQGGCIIESSNCTVDATIASQLEIISEAIK